MNIAQLRKAVLAHTDIAELIGSYTKLIKINGVINDYKACCPLPGHNDSTPSLYISTSKRVFKCYGCNEGGNAITFWAKMNNISNDEALLDLAKRAGLSVNNEYGSERTTEELNKITADRKLLETMRDRYMRSLREHPEALNYLRSRGFTDETIEKFDIGYCHYGDLNHTVATGQISHTQLASMLDLGLIGKKEDSYFDMMSRRIVIPINNANGDLVGFAGRLIGPGHGKQPKYLNTRESHLFKKSELLFGLDHAIPEIRKNKSVILVEGYMDVAMLHQHGIQNVCGLMGTSVSSKAFENLWSMSNEIVFCLDGDKAGRSAALRNMLTAATSMEDGKYIRVAMLPEGMDPDEYVINHGKEAMQVLVQNALPMSTFIIDMLSHKYTMEYPEGRAAFLREIDQFAHAFKNCSHVGEQIREEANAFCLGYVAKAMLKRVGVTQDEFVRLQRIIQSTSSLTDRPAP